MSRPAYRAMTAGLRMPREVVNVDFAEVMRQAVENERARTLREVRKAMDRVGTTEPIGGYSYKSRNVSAEDYKKYLGEEIDRMEER